MINPNELRIGNIILCNDKISKVLGLTIHNGWGSVWVDSFIYEYDDSSLLSRCNPIPITEEWLIKLGFNKKGIEKEINFEGAIKYENEKVFDMVFYFELEFYYIIDVNTDKYEDYVYTTKIFKYIHQLQNLYFALTGKELEIKEVGI